MGYVRGDSKTAKNSRLRLSQKFLSDLEEHYNKIGHRAIEIVFQERPAEYLKYRRAARRYHWPSQHGGDQAV